MNKQKGFTLIELLVVIAIISILSAVALASLNSGRIKARAAVIASELNEIDKAFRASAASQNWPSDWPIEGQAFGNLPIVTPGITTLSRLISDGYLEFISIDLSRPSFGTGIYGYDNDNDFSANVYNCPGNNSDPTGVALFMRVSSITEGDDALIVEELDDIFDGGNGLGCGRIRVNFSNGNPIFVFSLHDNS